MAVVGPELRTGVHSLWDQGLLFDYTIEVDGHKFQAHKVFLASVSGYFKVLLTNGMRESRQDRLKLQGFSSLAVKNVLEFIYKKDFGQVQASSDELFKLSMYLDIPSAITVCTNELCEGLSPENCLDIFDLFMMHNVTKGTEQVTEYIKKNIDAVLKVQKVQDLPFEVVTDLHECLQKSEWDLFCSLRDWVNADYDKHKQHSEELLSNVNGLMSTVRFALMTPPQLEAVKDQFIYKVIPGAWHSLVAKAMTYHSKHTHEKVLIRSKRTQIRTSAIPVCFPVGDNNSAIHVFHKKNAAENTNCLQARHTWKEHKGNKTPKFSAGVVTIVVNNFLIAYDQLSKGMYIFDPRTLIWSNMATVAPRDDFALVHHDQYLYALGGRVGTDVVPYIKRYNFQTNEWTIIMTQLPYPIHKHAACVVQDTIYICGGKPALAGPDTKKMHSIDLTTNTWFPRARMLVATSGHKLATADLRTEGRPGVLFVLTDNLNLQKYYLHTNQWTLLICGTGQPFKLNPNSKILNDCNLLWLLNVTMEVDTQAEPGRAVDPREVNSHGVCVKGRLSSTGLKLKEVPGRFPLYVDGADQNRALVKTYFSAILSVPLHLQKTGAAPRPAPSE